MGPIASAVMGLVLIPIITRFISPEEYGKASMFTLAQGLVAMILYMGMDQAYAREYARNREKRQKLMANAIALPMILSLICGALLILLRDWVSVLLFGTADEPEAILLMAVMFPFMVLQHFALVKIRFEEKGLRYSFFTVMLKVWTLALSVGLLLTFERSFRSVVYAAALAEILNGLLLCVVTFKDMRLRVDDLDKAQLAGLLRFALPLIPTYVLSWTLTSIDKVMLRALCGYTDLGLYAAAWKIVAAVGIVQSSFTSFWLPVAFRWHEEKQPQAWFLLVMKLVAALMSCMCFGILMCKDLVAYVLGESFAQAIAIFPFLLLYPIMYTMSETTSVGIAISRRTEFNLIITVLSSGTNVALNFLLIPMWGGVGAAVATGVSYVVLFWARALISRKLWWEFPVTHFAGYTGLVLINCAMHTFGQGFLPYLLSAASIVLVVVSNIPVVKSGMQLLRSTEHGA